MNVSFSGIGGEEKLWWRMKTAQMEWRPQKQEAHRRQVTAALFSLFAFPLFSSLLPHIYPVLNVFSQRSGFPVSVFSFQPSHPPSSRVSERSCLSSEAVPMINKITMWSPELIFFPSCAVNLTQTTAGRGGAFERLGRPHSLSRIDEIFARLHMAPLSSSNWKDLTPATAFLLWSRPSTSQSMWLRFAAAAESLLKSHLVHFPLIFSALLPARGWPLSVDGMMYVQVHKQINYLFWLQLCYTT